MLYEVITPCSDPKGVALNDESLDHASRANALVIPGTIAIAAGVLLYATAPKRNRKVSRITSYNVCYTKLCRNNFV